MQVKVFKAKDMTSGLKKVKEALGPDALILSTRTIKRGGIGLLGKPIMEITAAVDLQWSEDSLSTKTENPWRNDIAKTQDDLSYDDIWERSRKPVQERQPTNRPEFRQPEPPSGDGAIRSELNELRELVQGLSKRLSSLDTPGQHNSEPRPTPVFHGGKPDRDDRLASELLNSLGLNPRTAQTLADFTRQNFQGRQLPDPEILQEFLRKTIAGLLKVNPVLTEKPAEQKRMALIGPTGVGKTTSIAKIAANYISRFGNNIALITIDTYRIAAVEQLKVYGEIMNLPVEVVIKPERLEQAVRKFGDKDLVLIDTAGRNPRNSSDMQELTRFLRPHLNIENHLVLSATTRETEMDEAIQLFRCLRIDNIIYTKIDECKLLGILLNMHIKNETPISFLTNGQRVPEDIITPDPHIVAGLIMDNHRISNNV